jgi:DNA-binding response OmpR family regulator
VAIASSPDDGLALVDRLVRNGERPVVITDIFMPDRDGLELTSHIKRTYAAVPVIAISGGGAAGDRSYLVAARAFGADFTLPKPFRPVELRAAVDELLRRG